MEQQLYEILIHKGFKVIKQSANTEISNKMIAQYDNLPTEYLDFVKMFKEIKNETETVWFNLNKEFNGESESEFKWNEFELMSREWSEDDPEELKKVEEFWKQHIPIVLSVKNGYQFLAINLGKEKYGEIVHGEEPVFEEVAKVCNNFNELIDLLGERNVEDIPFKEFS